MPPGARNRGFLGELTFGLRQLAPPFVPVGRMTLVVAGVAASRRPFRPRDEAPRGLGQCGAVGVGCPREMSPRGVSTTFVAISRREDH